MIIRKRQHVEVEKYSLSFEYVQDPGSGFGFDCDKDGNVLPMNSTARENYEKCLAGVVGDEPVRCVGVRGFSYSYVESAVLRCSCGREVDLDGFTNTCDCGRDYSSSGQLLGPRSDWGSETGESLSDILRIR